MDWVTCESRIRYIESIGQRSWSQFQAWLEGFMHQFDYENDRKYFSFVHRRIWELSKLRAQITPFCWSSWTEVFKKIQLNRAKTESISEPDDQLLANFIEQSRKYRSEIEKQLEKENQEQIMSLKQQHQDEIEQIGQIITVLSQYHQRSTDEIAYSKKKIEVWNKDLYQKVCKIEETFCRIESLKSEIESIKQSINEQLLKYKQEVKQTLQALVKKHFEIIEEIRHEETPEYYISVIDQKLIEEESFRKKQRAMQKIQSIINDIASQACTLASRMQLDPKYQNVKFITTEQKEYKDALNIVLEILQKGNQDQQQKPKEPTSQEEKQEIQEDFASQSSQFVKLEDSVSSKQQLELKVVEMQVEIQGLRKELEQSKRDCESLKQKFKVQVTEQQNEDLDEKMNCVLMEEESLSPKKQDDQLTNKIADLTEQVNSLQKTLQSKERLLLESQKRLDEKNMQLQRLQLNLTSAQNKQELNESLEVQGRNDDLVELPNKNLLLEQNLKLKSVMLAEVNRTVEAMKKQQSRLNQELTKKADKLGEVSKQLEDFQSDEDALKKQFNKLQQLIRESEATVIRKDQQVAQVELKLKEVSEKMASKEETILSLTQQLLAAQQKVYELANVPQIELEPNHSHPSLFNHCILEDKPSQQQYLAETIYDAYGWRVTHTRLIFQYDPLNKTNFHKYIDDIPDTMVVIQMSNGYRLAVYSQGAFRPKARSEKGLIISITHQEVFRPKVEGRVITFDDYYLIYGNSEVRLKANEKKIFSNFGIANSFFDHRGKSVDLLLGGDRTEREMAVEGYEIYQLVLE